MFSFFHPLKYDQKRKSEQLEIFFAVESTADWAVSLSCMKPANMAGQPARCSHSNPRRSRLKHESNIMLLNRKKE